VGGRKITGRAPDVCAPRRVICRELLASATVTFRHIPQDCIEQTLSWAKVGACVDQLDALKRHIEGEDKGQRSALFVEGDSVVQQRIREACGCQGLLQGPQGIAAQH
jgi:hypothetical protein